MAEAFSNGGVSFHYGYVICEFLAQEIVGTGIVGVGLPLAMEAQAPIKVESSTPEAPPAEAPTAISLTEPQPAWGLLHHPGNEPGLQRWNKHFGAATYLGESSSAPRLPPGLPQAVSAAPGLLRPPTGVPTIA